MRKQTPNPTNKDIYDLLLLTYEKVKTLEQRVDLIEKDLIDFKKEMYEFRDEMHAFKKEMYEFMNDMLGFKSDVLAYQEENENFRQEMYDFRSETRMNFVSVNYRLDQIEDKISVLPEMQGDINMLKDQYVGLNSFINGELVVIQHTLGKHDKILSKIKD